MTVTNHYPVSIAPAPPNSHGPPALSSQSPAADQAMPYTCLTCTRRKVKCDKLSPICSTCRKSKLECQYQAPVPRKRRRLGSDALQDRLDQYKKILKDHDLLPGATAKTTPGSSEQVDSTHNASPRRRVQREARSDQPTAAPDPHGNGKIIYAGGKARWIDTTLWRALGEDELGPVSDEGEDGDGDLLEQQTRITVRPEAALDPISSAVLGTGKPYVSLLDLHPTYDHAMSMWRAHVQNVEPIVKVLHIPTTTHLLQRAASSPSSISRATECICFAVYHFAVRAMSEDECEAKLGESRSTLRVRYHNALRQSLVNAQFLRSTDFGVIQAFILFCLSVRTEYDQQTFWILTGIAVRLGQRIGLHRDGVDLGLKPFDTQMRRRLFWQLLPLDGLASQLTGTGIAMPANTWTTKQPWNLNDADIWPDMTTAPTERTGATDMIFCLTRSEVGKFHQKAKPSLGSWPRLWGPAKDHDISDLEALIRTLEVALETKYIRYCDTLDPVHCLTIAMARGGTAVARFRIRLHRFLSPQPPNNTNANTTASVSRQETLDHALRVLDYATSSITNPSLARFRWHMDAFFTWDALVFVLNELRREDPLVEPEAAWKRVETILETNAPFLEQKRALHVATGTLTLKAWEARPAPGKRVPRVITVLKEAAARREAVRERRKRKVGKEGGDVAVAVEGMGSVGSTGAGSVGEGLTPFMSSEQLDEVMNLEDMDWSSWDQLFTNPDSMVPFPT